ncbi:MAG: CHAP domain-containing protein [Ruminococcus sp.]|nr:CHAP domain-containing protein [Ruminococcus sp.]
MRPDKPGSRKVCEENHENSSQGSEPVSQDVLDYTPVIQQYVREYGIPDYVQVIQTIMMQESRGQGTDPMQASECPFNTRYPNSPNGITDPKYSIQVGNEGGEKFWSWYGFSQREKWCANQCGLIASGAVPKFAFCPAGVEWFQSNGKWKDNSYSPAAGTVIFFDWNGDGVSDHVGIVEKCENGRVYTVEGNSNDRVQQSIYTLGSNLIMGYGILKNLD